MYVKFKFSYNTIYHEVGEGDERRREWAISKEKYEKLRELISDLPEDPLDSSEENRYINVHWQSYVGHLESVLELVSKIEIEEVLRTKNRGLNCLDEMLHRITNNLREIETRIDRYQEQLFNKKVNVHVPGNALLEMERVHYETDCCTDRLAELLEQGWRIIAVCPQPDQRRPDYVLGMKGVTDV